MAELNERVVKSLAIPKTGNEVHYYKGAVLQGTVAPAGFGVCVTAKDNRSFILDYRNREHKQRRYTIGTWPDWTALKAVKEARELRRRIDKGEDPQEEKAQAKKAQAKRAEEGKSTLRSVCEEYLKREGAKLRTADWRKRVLERLVYPVKVDNKDWPGLGPKDIATIKRSDVNRLLDKIEDDNGAVMADRTLAIIRKVMNWHAARSDDFNSPIVRGMARTKPAEHVRDRTLTDDELRRVWTAAEADTGPFGRFVRFCLLTGCRRAEAAGMPWDEIEDGIWTLPKERNKVKSQDLVRPLNQRATALLPPKAGKFVFSTNGGASPISGFDQLKKGFDKACGITEHWTIHDLRRTARTLLGKLNKQVSVDVAELCLGHKLPVIRGTYDKYGYFDEKAAAYAALAARIESIVSPRKTMWCS